MERTLKPEVLKSKLNDVLILDVRRQGDYAASADRLPGSAWRNPEAVDQWLVDIPQDQEVVIYCVRGGSVSNATVDKLQAAGLKARFIEGGIEGWKASGGEVVAK